MTKGDIIRGRRTNHPIIFLRRLNPEQFVGCILTHARSDNYIDNIQLRPEHFLPTDQNGNRYQTRYDNTYFVAIELIKEQDWGPFTKTGQLSQIGIEFVDAQLQALEPLRWTEYIEN
jgi:hypothetical protein